MPKQKAHISMAMRSKCIAPYGQTDVSPGLNEKLTVPLSWRWLSDGSKIHLTCIVLGRAI
jgi:hypothetical protein